MISDHSCTLAVTVKVHYVGESEASKVDCYIVLLNKVKSTGLAHSGTAALSVLKLCY